MSAIVAAVGDGPLAGWVEQATALSRRAGPDGAAVHHEPNCSLGHAWLRASPNEAVQPVTLDRRTWLTADVRLDDRRTLWTKLRARGRDVTTGTPDAELVLHAYAVWGEHCVEHLAGDFAFALWDTDRRRLFCARDQLGIAPLHYAMVPRGVLVATAIDALRLHPDVSDELDETAIVDFLIGGHSNDFTSTAYAAIRRLPPAHTLTWSADGSTMNRYWRLPTWEPLLRHRTADACVEEFVAVLDEAVADRVTTVQLSVQLSGGLDSTNVAASAALTLTARGAPPGALRAVTAVLGGESADREGEAAAMVARALGVELDVIDASTMPALDPYADPLVITPEPTPYQRTAFNYELAARAAQHSAVALGGHGGDALVWSSPWYWAAWLAHGRVARLGHAVADHRRLFGARLHPGLRSGLLGYANRHRRGREPVPTWFAPGPAGDIASGRSAPLRVRPAHLDARGLANEPLWTALAGFGHPAVTGLPLRYRYPMLDLRLVRLARSLPPEPWLQDKRILREAARGRLPDEIRRRPKVANLDAPAARGSEAADQRMAEFVRDVPELGRFVDAAALGRELAAAASWARDSRLALPLGLAHWLAHRAGRDRRIDASALVVV